MRQTHRSGIFSMKTLFTALLLQFFMLPLFAQVKNVTGVVKDQSGETVIAASVVVKGTTVGTVTNIDGVYNLDIPANGNVLVFSYVGMQTQEIPITSSIINVILKDDARLLDDVVVIGYGTARRRDLTGTVASLSSGALRDIPVTSAAEALSGKLAGVQVTTTEGSPDADIKIRVRGGGSITGDNSPLYIVDGFPVSSIADIPPSTIKSIDVLKDASSTAIYGSQGANGVIIISTKDPNEDGAFSVNYTGYLGWKKITKTLPVLETGDFARWQYELQAMKGGNNIKDRFSKFFNPLSPELAIYTADDYNAVMNIYDGIEGTNWQNRIFGNTGTTQNHSVSIMGGGKAATFNLSYNSIKDNAIMLASDYVQDNMNFKLSSRPVKFLKVDLSARYSDTKVNGSGGNDVTSSERSTADSRLRHSVIYTPTPLKNYTDDGGVDEEEVGNLYPPDEVIYDNWKQTRRINYSFNGSVSATISKGLVFRSEFGLNNTKSDTERYYGPTAYFSRIYPANANAYQKMGIVTMQNANSYRIRNANTITYDKKNINKSDHSFNILLGEETVITKSDNLYTEIAGLPDYLNYADAFAFTTTGAYPAQISNVYDPDDKLLSFFGRANYDYKGIYLFTATLRADGSSKFAKGNRWGYFPSIAGAWRLSDEDFMKDQSYWISNLKPRLSIGTVGNSKIASGQYMVNYAAGSAQSYIPHYSNLVFSAGDLLPNPDLRWETTITRNFGIDYGFFNNRLSGNVDMYYNNTKDLLLLLELSGSGYTGQYKNIGSTENRGIEIMLNGIAYDKKNFGLDISANVSFNKGKVVALDGRDEFFVASTWAGSTLQNNMDYIVKVGEPVGQMYGYVTAGRYGTDDFMWNGIAWTMNTDKYNVADVAPDGVTPIFKDAQGNVFVNNSGLTRKSWGPGALKLQDLNGDGRITVEDQQIIGSSAPKATGGFAINTRAYNFDLSANFNWVLGNNIYNANKIEFTSAGLDSWYGRNLTTEMNASNRWSNIDPLTAEISTDVNRLSAINSNTSLWSPELNGYIFHSWAVEDGSFLRLSSLSFGYSLPRELLKKVHIQNLRFYVTASNLFVLTKYTGYDPEVDTRRRSPLTPGVDYSAYPKSRSFNLGVNLNF
ncbi:MAG: TonB-dependent receptor [Paludibacter sp.]|nr:TonB-dependent receptor [Paludibacter sp.]